MSTSPMLGEVLEIKATLRLVTPLVIHGGTSSWSQGIIGKARNQGLRYSKYKRDEEGWTQLGDLLATPEVRDGSLRLDFQLPASSLRGALRGWAAQQLLPESLQEALLGDDEDAAKALLGHVQGAALMGLFGYASAGDTGSRRGRLQVEGGRFRSPTRRSGLDIPGARDPHHWHEAPQQDFNVDCHVKTRSPLDRITGGTLSGALHSFLEILPGAETPIRLLVSQPTASDRYILKGLLSDLDAGLMRLGGLTRIGRGRVRVVDELWTLRQFAVQPEAEDVGDPLDWLYRAATLDAASLQGLLTQSLTEVCRG